MRRYGVHFRHAGRYQIFNKRGEGDVAEVVRSSTSAYGFHSIHPLSSPGCNLYRCLIFLRPTPNVRPFQRNDPLLRVGRRGEIGRGGIGASRSFEIRFFGLFGLIRYIYDDNC